MVNKCVKELVEFINVYQIYPKMFRQVVVGVKLEYIDESN
jgi:hypothetical protein